MDILGKLFDSSARVKMMRLFVLNPEAVYGKKDIQQRCQISAHAVGKELGVLTRGRLIQKRAGTKAVTRKRGTKTETVKAKIKGWAFDPRFPHAYALKALLIEGAEYTPEVIARKFKNIGRVRLLLVSGIFINSDLSRVDILLVGEHLKKNVISSILKSIESEVGKELRYAIFETEDFKYRISIYDKFVRDVLDDQHVRVIDKLGVR